MSGFSFVKSFVCVQNPLKLSGPPPGAGAEKQEIDSGGNMNAMMKHAWCSIVAVAAVLFLQSAPLLPQTRTASGGWVEARGARVHVPDGWSYNERLVAASGPINMTNFGGAYARGGLLPPDGAEIEVTSLPAPPNIVEYIKKELKAAKVDRLQEMAAGEKSGIQASYVETISADTSLKTVVSYIAHGSSLYKFYLSYWSGNRNEQGLAAAFEQVIQEAQLR